MKVLRRLLALLVLLFVLAGAVLGYLGYSFLNTPPEHDGRDVSFDVAPGARLSTVAVQLKEAGLITDERAFILLARYKKMQNGLKAGRFALNTSWLPLKVLDTLVNGRPVLYRITIPEGLTWWQTGELLAKNGFVEAEAFARVVADPEFLKHYGVPFTTAEGFLMPDTYLLKKPELENVPREVESRSPSGVEEKGATAELKTGTENVALKQARAVAGRLVDTFWQKAAALWPGGKKPSREEIMRVVILASIVEKETAIREERARVAGVYTNRLARHMLLQADPTVIYGLGPDFSGRLLFRHLDDAKNPYNTYQRAGLPPGPICSFGLSALRAALSPEKHDFLYFVAREDGGSHVFSVRLEDHNRAVREYRKRVRENKRN